MCFVKPSEVLAKPVVSGLGEEIGIVVGVEPYPSGFVHKLWVLERDAPAHEAPRSPGRPRAGAAGVVHTIDERFVRAVTEEQILLKGPREGFHITRLRGDEPHAAIPRA